MNQNQDKMKSTREHLDAIFNARNVLSFVGEAIGKSNEDFSESANAGVYLITEYLRADLESAANALTSAIYRKPGCMDVHDVGSVCASGVEGRVSN